MANQALAGDFVVLGYTIAQVFGIRIQRNHPCNRIDGLP